MIDAGIVNACYDSSTRYTMSSFVTLLISLDVCFFILKIFIFSFSTGGNPPPPLKKKVVTWTLIISESPANYDFTKIYLPV